MRAYRIGARAVASPRTCIRHSIRWASPLLVVLAAVTLFVSTPEMALAQSNWLPVRIDAVVPNPLNEGLTEIRFVVPTAGEYNLKVYSVDGALIASILESEATTGGTYFATWDGRGHDGSLVANGLYFCRLQFGYFIQTAPIVVMR